MATKSTAAERPRAAAEPGRIAMLCVLAWLIPGAGHLMQGRRDKGLVFLIALPAFELIDGAQQSGMLPVWFTLP